jgi:hypothetical protein
MDMSFRSKKLRTLNLPICIPELKRTNSETLDKKENKLNETHHSLSLKAILPVSLNHSGDIMVLTNAYFTSRL